MVGGEGLYREYVILRLYGDNGQENGNYYLAFRGLGSD